ncbi:MAG: hypothetical protein GX443_01720 [Deltaproteobacteria bacterium]|nr:hypothetical protein [Deltaproteobacteria bacterium]
MRRKGSGKPEEFVQGLPPLEGQVGAIFFSQAGVLGAGLFAARDLFARAYGKIIRSSAFEALSDPQRETIPAGVAKRWRCTVLETPMSLHPSPGAGENIQCASGKLIGSGLCRQDACVHFSCFSVSKTPEELKAELSLNAKALETKENEWEALSDRLSLMESHERERDS